MATPARIRFYQYPVSPYCIPVELILKHGSIPYEIVDLPYGMPAKIIELTRGAYYQVPVLEDLATRELIYEKEAGDEVPRYLAGLAPLLNLFPDEVAGLQRILIHYIENDCEAVGFKINDSHRDKWLKNEVEMGLHRRHKERKFGPGCLEEWTRREGEMTAQFSRLIEPFEKMLGQHPFLTGDHPVFADYALCGVLGNFLYSGATQLPVHFLMLQAWYTKMCAGNFKNPMDDFQLQQGGAATGITSTRKLLSSSPDFSDVQRVLTDIKLRPGSAVLNIPSGDGQLAAFLAEKEFAVTAADASVSPEDTAIAERRQLAVTFHEHAAEQLPYADSSFALVICRGTARYLNAPEAFVREATRVLKTYGFLVVIDDAVPDDHVEANNWLNSLERLRDPAHVKFNTPHLWRHWCVQSGLTVVRAQVDSVRQPDLQGYLDETDTSPENRKKVLESIAKAPTSVREVFRLGQDGGKIIWDRRRLTLVAGKM